MANRRSEKGEKGRLQGWRPLLVEAILAGLATWFAIVAITAVPNLLPQRIQPQMPPDGTSYLDDFGVFYTAGALMRQGHGAAEYQLDALHAAEARTFRASTDNFEPLPYFNPPYALLIFAPLSMLSLGVAAALWVVTTFALAAAGIWLLLKAYPLRLGALAICCLALGIISSLPAYQTAVHGQLSFLLVFGLCLLYVSMRRPQARFSVPGLLILSLKPQLLLLPVILLLFQRRYRELAIAFAGGVGLLLAALVFTGAHTLTDYVNLLVSSTSWDSENGISTLGMFGWVGMVGGIMGGEMLNLQRVVVLALDLTTLAVAGWVIYRGIEQKRSPVGLLSLAVVAGLLASPHFYAQDLLLLVPVLLVFISTTEPDASLAYAFALAGWFVAFAHFTVLGFTHMNLTTLYMLALLSWLIVQNSVVSTRQRRRVPAGARASEQSISHPGG